MVIHGLSPTPYGVVVIVHDGRLLGYHYLTEGQILEALDRAA